MALLFIDFTRDVIGLHVNGRAELVTAQQIHEQAPSVNKDEHPGRRPVLWVVVRVDEAYVHCSKHIPLLVPLPKQQHWGTDDHKRKGGDFFHVAASRRGDAGLHDPRRVAAPGPTARPDAVGDDAPSGRAHPPHRGCSLTVLRLRDCGSLPPPGLSGSVTAAICPSGWESRA